MVVLGLLLIGLAVLLAAGVAASSGNRATLDIFGVGFDTRSSVVFFFGVAIGIALIAGLWLTKLGLARGIRRRKEVRRLRQRAQAAPAGVAELPDGRTDTHDDDGRRSDAGPQPGPEVAPEVGPEVAAGNDGPEPVGQHRADSDPNAGSDREAVESPVTAPREVPRRHTEVRE